MKIKQKIHKFQEIIFNYVIIITYILYFIMFLGFSSKAPQYLNYLQEFTKIYVSSFLVFRFNPFRNIEFTEFDSKIAFSAGLFLFTTSVLPYVNNYINKIKFLKTEKFIKENEK